MTYKPYKDATTIKEKLLALIDVCQSMHVIMPQGQGDSGFPACRMNPAALVCTCKGYRMIGLCSHVITVTATYILEKECQGGGKTYDQEDLEQLVEKLVTKKRTSHRPRAVVGGAHIQPHGDSEDESEPEDEDLDEDLSAI